MHYDVATMPREIGKVIWAALIAPRPIALISTLDEQGVPNIAPYNSFAGVANHPALISLSFGRREGQEKFTYANIAATQQFVVNLVSFGQAETMNLAAEGEEKTDDFMRLGLTRGAFEAMPVPYVAECPASLACSVLKIIDLAPAQCTLVVAQVSEVRFDAAFNHEGVFDPKAANLLASVGVEDYLSLTGDGVHLPRTWK
jgi:flavin reductase (DIM6/NTAB) family NADH-FMN oxidoreductase RutF